VRDKGIGSSGSACVHKMLRGSERTGEIVVGYTAAITDKSLR